MQEKLPPNRNIPFTAKLLPYIMIGLTIVLFVIGLVIFSYLLIIAAIVGFILFAINFIRTKFFKKEDQIHTYHKDQEKQQGRIIEYEEEVKKE